MCCGSPPPDAHLQGFWTNIKDAVYEKRDADGFRCEILCSECDGCVSVFWPCTPRQLASHRHNMARIDVRSYPVNNTHTNQTQNQTRHLGHVFRNEGFPNPPPNERHCVNGVSVAFVPEGKAVAEAILPTYDGPVYEG